MDFLFLILGESDNPRDKVSIKNKKSIILFIGNSKNQNSKENNVKNSDALFRRKIGVLCGRHFEFDVGGNSITSNL